MWIFFQKPTSTHICIPKIEQKKVATHIGFTYSKHSRDDKTVLVIDIVSVAIAFWCATSFGTSKHSKSNENLTNRGLTSKHCVNHRYSMR